MDSLQNKLTAKEKFFFFNTLSVLVKAVVGHKTTIDLRNESTVYGTVAHADAFMNVTMKDCYFTDPGGNTYKYDMFFVHTRNIRTVHIPPHIRIVPAISNEIDKLSGKKRMIENSKIRTFKGKRTQEKHKKDLQLAKEILEKKRDMTSKSET